VASLAVVAMAAAVVAAVEMCFFSGHSFFRLYLPEKKTNGNICLVRFLCHHNAILPDIDTHTDYKKQLMSNKKTNWY
jgi:hypothetical protein